MTTANPPALRVTVEPSDVGDRLDVVLARRMAGVSRNAAKALLAEGRVRVEGRAARGSDRVTEAARIEVRLDPSPADPSGLDVIRADADYIYVLKPAGIHTVRLRPTDPPTLADAVAQHFPECRTLGARAGEAGAVHRLDQDTSGLVAFARSADAWTAARAAMSSSATKLYLARCHRQSAAPPGQDPSRDVSRWDARPPWNEPGPLPRPAEDGLRICAPLAGTGPKGAHTAVRDDGLPAESHVWWLQPPGPELRDALVELVSGRRHQARVHLAHLGSAILGDARYGPGTDGAHPDRPLHLHAVGLRLGPQNPWVWAPLPTWF